MTEAPNGELRLHLGCGPDIVPGWENLDKSPSVLLAKFPRVRAALFRARIINEQQAQGFPEGAIHVDLAKGIPYPDESARYAYTAHMIEHLSRWQGLRVMRECLRVLSPGGTVRVVTPNLRDLVDSYLNHDFPPQHQMETAADSFMSELQTFREIEGSRSRQLLWRLTSGVPHQWMYDQESLMSLLREAGFPDPVVRTYREGLVPDLDKLEHRPRSIFVEATKPVA